MRIIIRLLLTFILWPLWIVIFVLRVRKSLAGFPERLGFADEIDVEIFVEDWLRFTSRVIPFGKVFWFTDKPQKR